MKKQALIILVGLMMTSSFFGQSQEFSGNYSTLSAAISLAVADPAPVMSDGPEVIACSGSRICLLWMATVAAQERKDDNIAFALTLLAVSGHPPVEWTVKMAGPSAVASFLRNEQLHCDPGPCQAPGMALSLGIVP